MARVPISSASPDPSALTGPVRTCVGCRARAPKSELLRVTAGSDSDGSPAVLPDPGATAQGRGAHLHPTLGCFDLAVRRKAFGRALRVPSGLSGTPLAEHLTRLAATAAPAPSVLPAAPRPDRPETTQELEQ